METVLIRGVSSTCNPGEYSSLLTLRGQPASLEARTIAITGLTPRLVKRDKRRHSPSAQPLPTGLL